MTAEKWWACVDRDNARSVWRGPRRPRADKEYGVFDSRGSECMLNDETLGEIKAFDLFFIEGLQPGDCVEINSPQRLVRKEP